jgi:hypothetical protein
VDLWVKLLASQLEQADIVKFANIRPNTVLAVYKTGIREVYYFKVKKRKKHRGDNCFVVTPESAAINQQLPIFKKYNEDPLDESSISYHWCINRSQFNNATFIEKRIAMHRLFYKIYDTKNMPDCYPQHVLDKDWKLLQAKNYSKFLINGALTCFPTMGLYNPRHFRILAHFFNSNSDLDRVALWGGLRLLYGKKNVPINSSNARKFARHFARRIIIDPLMYCALFKSLGITGAVGDLHPGWGSKALACALMDLPYYTIKNDRFQRALDLGFSSFTRGEFGWLDDQKLELLISDDNLKNFQMPGENLLNQTKHLICYSDKKNKQKLSDEYNPINILQLYNKPKESKMLKNPNYLFFW